jgi:hypothetical protein
MMQVALDDKNVSPLDATLESGMPGMHQRFVAMDGTVKTLDRKILAGIDKLDTKVDGLANHFTDLQADKRERNAKLVDSLWALAERLGTPAGSTPPFWLQQDNNKSNRQVVVATINLLHQALLMLLGATEWSPSTIRSNRCGTNGMGLKTAKTSLWLVGLPQWRSSISRNGESTSRLPKKKRFTVTDCNPVDKHSLRGFRCDAGGDHRGVRRSISGTSQVVNGKYGHHCPGAWTRDKKKHRGKARQPH